MNWTRPFVSARHRPEESLWSLEVAHTKGLPLARRLTDYERLALAITAAAPTHRLDISSPGMDREELSRAWTTWLKRISRRKNSSGPLIYAAVAAQSENGRGHHLHALTWEFLPVLMTRKAARETGLGMPHHIQLPRFSDAPWTLLGRVAYVLGQHAPVFGSSEHSRHRPRDIGQHRVMHPKLTTLQQHCPQLSSALHTARNRAVSDIALLDAFPRSSRYTAVPVEPCDAW